MRRDRMVLVAVPAVLLAFVLLRRPHAFPQGAAGMESANPVAGPRAPAAPASTHKRIELPPSVQVPEGPGYAAMWAWHRRDGRQLVACRTPQPCKPVCTPGWGCQEVLVREIDPRRHVLSVAEPAGEVACLSPWGSRFPTYMLRWRTPPGEPPICAIEEEDTYLLVVTVLAPDGAVATAGSLQLDGMFDTVGVLGPQLGAIAVRLPVGRPTRVRVAPGIRRGPSPSVLVDGPGGITLQVTPSGQPPDDPAWEALEARAEAEVFPSTTQELADTALAAARAPGLTGMQRAGYLVQGIAGRIRGYLE